MKTIILFSAILFGLSNCHSEDEITLERCDRNNLAEVEKLNNAIGIIKKSEITGLYNIYEIEVGAFGKGLPLNPCNLPLEFRIQDLKISFSGQLLEPDDWDFSDFEAHPIELTFIKSPSNQAK